MHNNLTTPLALVLAAALLLVISFIPPAASRAHVAQPDSSMSQWVASIPLEREEHRLALVLAVHAAAWAIDQAVVTFHEPRTAQESISAPVPASTARRVSKPARPMMPFYSFASTAQRPQES